MELLRLHVRYLFRALLCAALAFCPHIPFAQAEVEVLTTPSSPQESVAQPPPPEKTEKELAAEQRTQRIEATTSFTQGQILEAEGRKAEALECYIRASKADPNFLPTVIRKAYLFTQLDRTDEAITSLQELLTQDPTNAETLALMALCQLKKDNREEAKKLTDQALQCALKDTSQDGEFYDRIADMIAKLSIDLNNATPTDFAKQLLPLFEKALETNPRNLSTMSRVAEMQISLSNPQKALELYEKIHSIAPRYPQIREKIIITLLSTGKEARAIEMIEQMLETDPTNKKLYPLLGELYDRAKKWDKAEENYLMSLHVGNNSAQDYILATFALLKNKKASTAVDILKDAEERYPEIPQLPFARGIALRANKQPKESIQSFTKAEKLGQIQEGFLNSNFYFEFGSSYEQAKDSEMAERMFQKSLQLDPKNHMAMNYLGYMWAEQKTHLDEAEKMLKNALDLDPNNPAYQDSLGWVYYQKSDFESARKYIGLAIQQMTDDPVVNDHMGDVMLKLGDVVKAMEYWASALPQSDERDRIEAKIRMGKEEITMQYRFKQ